MDKVQKKTLFQIIILLVFYERETFSPILREEQNIEDIP
jgi:hypothetical protein